MAHFAAHRGHQLATSFWDLTTAKTGKCIYLTATGGGANMPRMSPSGYTTWGGATESPLADWGLGFKYTASWRKGDHYLKFGVEHVRNLDVHYYWIPAYAAGGDTFDGFGTGQLQYNPDGSFAGVTQGEGWADFMLGTPSRVFGKRLGNRREQRATSTRATTTGSSMTTGRWVRT